MQLTNCGPVTPYGGRDLGQHWFRQWLVAWRHQAITWTNVDLTSLMSSDVHLRAISLEISQPSVTKISLKVIFLRFYWSLTGANELILQVFISSSYRKLISSHEIDLRWVSYNPIEDNSTLVQAMAWCHQAPSHCQGQCRIRYMLLYGMTWPQWVKLL